MRNAPKTIEGTKYVVPAPIIEADNPYTHLQHPQSDDSMTDRDKIIDQANKLCKISEDFMRIFQEECLIFLLTADKKWFLERFTGERTREGYLIDTNGQETNFLPSQNVNAGLDRVSKRALEKFSSRRREIDQILSN